MPHPAARIAGVVAACVALVLVWVAAVLVARSLLSADTPRGARKANKGDRANPNGRETVLDHSLTVPESHPYGKPGEWSTKRQE